MIRAPAPYSPEVSALLNEERSVPPVPAAVRMRVVARAQAVLLGAATNPETRTFAPPRHASGRRWAAAAALVGVSALAAGAGAYVFRARITARNADTPPNASEAAVPPPTRPLRAPRARPAEVLDVPETVAPQPPPEPTVELPRLARADARWAELRLLRRARDAVLRRDFSAALPPIAEHARRFKEGGLAEEREALRVKALAGLGRRAEAEQAAAAFKARFPRSVLSPAVGQMPAPGP